MKIYDETSKLQKAIYPVFSAIYKIIKLFSVLFVFIVIIEFSYIRGQDSNSMFFPEQIAVAKEYNKNNFMLLTGLSTEQTENMKYSNLRYLLFPTTELSMPYTLNIVKKDNKPVSQQKSSFIYSVLGILMLFWGIFNIVSFFRKPSQKSNKT